MSLLEKIKKKAKERIKNPPKKELKLFSINENIFPYSCLVADDVLLTKNGEVMQMIEILLDDFKLNQEGGLRDAIRNAIAENTNDLRTAFWIQTVKKKKAKSKTKHKEIKHEFLKRLYNVNQEMEEELNNYSTSVYITIIKQGRNFNLKYIKDYFSVKFLDYQHDKFIDKSIEEVKEITENIANMLSIYSPKILGIRKDIDNNEYSELLETLYFIINFTYKEIPISPIDATKLLNDGKYLFENGILAMQNNTNKKLTLGMSFSLKEVPNVRMSNVSDIINNTRAELIVTEYVSYVNQKVANNQFIEQKSFLKGREDNSFQKKVGLDFLNEGSDAKFCQSSLSVMVLASSTEELQTFVNDAISMFSKHGIVMAREDVSLERNYYAMMPANFIFTHRLTIHDAKEVGCFCYSYTPQESDTKEFLNETVLFNIGTLKGNPVPIGLDKVRTNVMIGGMPNSGKTTLANFLAGAIMREFETNLCIVEFSSKSRAFTEAIGGQWFRISIEKQNHTAIFNILNTNIFTNEQKKDEYLFEIFSLLLSANNVLITPEITIEIKKVVEYIKEFSKTNKKFALHDIRNALNGLSIDQELQCWHSIGKYYHLFDNRDDVFENNNLLSFYIDESVSSNSLILASIINHITTNVIQRAKHNTKPTLLILDEPFLAFGNNFFKNKLNKMIETMAKNNVICIFKVDDIEAESSTIVDFTRLINSCGIQMHFANKYANNNYGRVFHLEKLEYMAARTLAGYEGRNLIVKQNSGLYSCKFDMSFSPKTLGLLSDQGETQAKIFKLKEALQTDSYERWIPAYYGTFTSSENVEEQRKLEQELKAIQDIRRLMES